VLGAIAIAVAAADRQEQSEEPSSLMP
jgi:hypothetical protein